MKKFFKNIIQFYLKILTRIVLWRQKPKIIAVAGTTNKTFVKDKILEELGEDESFIRGNPRSFNTEIGLPLAVLFLPSGYSSIFKWVDILLTGTFISFFSRKFPKILVLEMGIDKKGDMRYLLSIVKPSMAIITNIDQNFSYHKIKSEEIVEEIELLIKAIPQEGVVILNGDDKKVEGLKKVSKAKTILYGAKGEYQFRIANIKETAMGQEFELINEGKKDKMETERFGQHNIYSTVAAKIAVRELNRKYLKDDKKKK